MGQECMHSEQTHRQTTKAIRMRHEQSNDRVNGVNNDVERQKTVLVVNNSITDNINLKPLYTFAINLAACVCL